MSELLLEIFSEEIPARLQVRAAADLERAVNQRLLDAGFAPEGVKGFAGPRRLTVAAAGIPVRQPDRREEKKGPRVNAPEKAIEGFLKSAGLTSLDQCEQRENKKGAYWVAVIDDKGRATADLIAEFVPEIIAKFSWPKSMRWGDSDLRWVRPLHRILCVFDGEVVDFEIGGVQSGDKTAGHRFMAPDVIQARNFDDYAASLRTAKVVLDSQERIEIISGDAATLCKAQGLELVEDKGLLNEVAGLAEWPVAMMGSFDEKFLALPDEVLTASMRGHQKYFSVRDPKTGRLANKFVCVANIEAPANAPKGWGKAMREGYERVLTARLSDGWYLYSQDLKTPLAERVGDLDKVKFFEGLGSVGDKARRIAALAKEIAPAVGADPELAERAALLAKADLVTGMVKEFPELQGVMGRYYALEQGEPAEIADAIRDHYKPKGQDDDVPAEPVSVAVALADKIDTLTAFWAIDKKPTGSSDPFALRRAALGVIAFVVQQGLQLKVRESFYRQLHLLWTQFIEQNRVVFLRNTNAAEVSNAQKVGTTEMRIDGYHVDLWDPNLEKAFEFKRIDGNIYIFGLSTSEVPPKEFEDLTSISFDDAWLEIPTTDLTEKFLVDKAKYKEKWDDIEIAENLFSFFHDRLKGYLKDKGHRHDHIDAVLTYADGNLQGDLVLIISKLEALEGFLKTDDGESLAAAYKRAANILKAEEKKDKSPAEPSAVKKGLLNESEEKALLAALESAEAKAVKSVGAEDFETAMTALSSLRAPLDAFFEKVTVNADDKDLRGNRLSLLARLRAATAKVADFSKLEG